MTLMRAVRSFTTSDDEIEAGENVDDSHPLVRQYPDAFTPENMNRRREVLARAYNRGRVHTEPGATFSASAQRDDSGIATS